MIVGKCGSDEGHNGICLDFDDYVIAAIMLYIDIIMIFIHILKIIGDKWILTKYITKFLFRKSNLKKNNDNIISFNILLK